MQNSTCCCALEGIGGNPPAFFLLAEATGPLPAAPCALACDDPAAGPLDAAPCALVCEDPAAGACWGAGVHWVNGPLGVGAEAGVGLPCSCPCF